MATSESLRGRGSECDALRRALDSARSGHSAVLVLRGEPGIGKTALLDFTLAAAAGCRAALVAGVEAEMELPFAGVHQLCVSFLDRVETLPPPQRDALRTAFGTESGPAPDRFLVGLAVLTLVAEIAREQPLVLLIDDAQWLDHVSSQVLSFVARRLHADPVVIVFATRNDQGDDELQGLPELPLAGLDASDAAALLDAAVHISLDDQVRDRLVAETRGNPLALLELPRTLRQEPPAGPRESDRPPVAQQIEDEFLRQIAQLPPQTQRLLLLASNEPVGDPTLLWRAASQLGINPDAALPAEAVGLLSVQSRVQFRHPLVRSAIRRSASLDANRESHAALAQAAQSGSDPDRRAWHMALAASAPDEAVAAELEMSADRARQRGGVAAEAAFLARAVALTPEAARRSERALRAARTNLTAGSLETCHELLSMTDDRSLSAADRARLGLLQAQLAFAARKGQDAAPLLLSAARQLEPVEPQLARQTYLDAISAAMFAGRLADHVGVGEAGRSARAALKRVSTPGLQDELLACLATLFSDNYQSAAPTMRTMLARLQARGIESQDLRYLWLVAACAADVWDDANWGSVAAEHVRVARELGALGELPLALNSQAVAHVFAGELTSAATLVAEIPSVVESTGTELAPYGEMALLAWRGREESLPLITASRVAATVRGEGVAVSVSFWAETVYALGHGNYQDALAAAQNAIPTTPELAVPKWALADLVEAAALSGVPKVAAAAFERLSEMTAAASTDWALGVEARARAQLGTDAEQHHRESIERLTRTRMQTELGRAHLLYGEWLLRAHRLEDARASLRVAHDLFHRIGATAFAARASRSLHDAGATIRPGTAPADTPLTDQELQIAHLARSGRTNAEIAAQLFLSPHTVEWHLRKVYSKLAIPGRKQLASRLTAGSTVV